MKIGFCEDWTQSATRKIQIIAETTDGRYVCRRGPDGNLFLRDKDEVKDVHEEELEVK